MPLIYDPLLKPLSRDNPDITIVRGNWYQWNSFAKSGRFDIDLVIGHSLGGHAALLFAQAYSPITVVTLDPRWIDNLSWTDMIIPWRRNFEAPPYVDVYNFYRKGLLSGYKVNGAVENTKVFSDHLLLPGHPKVKQKIAEIIKRIDPHTPRGF